MGYFGDFIIPVPDGNDATLEQARSIVQSFDDGFKSTTTMYVARSTKKGWDGVCHDDYVMARISTTWHVLRQ